MMWEKTLKSIKSWMSSALELPHIMLNMSSRVRKAPPSPEIGSNLMILLRIPNSTSLDWEPNRNELVIPYPLLIKKTQMTIVTRLIRISQRLQ